MSHKTTAKDYENLHVTSDILLLVGVDAKPSDVAQWTKGQQEAASNWASLEHLSASDNPVRRIPMPKFLKPFLKGRA